MDEEQHLAYVAYVKEKYFRTGINTRLHIQMMEYQHLPDTLTVQWSFTYLDLGCTHYITRPAAVVTVNPETHALYIDGVLHERGVEQAEDTIFGGYYVNYVRDLYEQEGIITGIV